MSDLRQQVRRDDDLPPMARLLFAEIWQMNEGNGECYAEDEWLGEQIGAAESTVRRHRLTLLDKGYIRQCKSGGRRYLEPNEVINIDQSDQKRSEMTSNNDQNDQKRSEEVINTDQHRGSNNPEGTRESAPAGDGASGSVTIDDTFSVLVDIWRDVHGTPPMQDRHMQIFERWSEELDVDPDLFRDVLRDQLDSTQGRGVGLDVTCDRTHQHR